MPSVSSLGGISPGGNAPTGVFQTPNPPSVLANALAGSIIATLSATGTGPFTFSVSGNTKVDVSGSNLILTAAGQGNLTPGGSENYTIRATNGAGHVDVPYSFNIPSGPASLSISPTLPSTLDNVPSGTTIYTGVVTGGTAPYVATDLLNNTKFSLSMGGSNLTVTRSATGTLTAGSPESQSIQITDAAGLTLPSPLSVSITVNSASAAQTITPLTVVNNSASAETGTPMTFGLPLAVGTNGLPSGRTIQILDSGVPVPCQIDRISDVDLVNSAQRHVVVTILADIGSSATKQLTIQNIPGSDLTGTVISKSDILATTFNRTVTILDPNGTWTCDAVTALSAGAYTNLLAAGPIGYHRYGPLAVDYIVIAPFMQGATVHPYLRCRFVVTAFKSQTGPVSGLNPIIAIRTDRFIENGNIDLPSGSPKDLWYTIVSDVCGTNSISWTAASNTVNLTLNSATIGTGKNLTAASAWYPANTDCVGWVITDGTGICVITGKTPQTSTTVAQVHTYKAFASTSLPAGSYQVYAINHTYGAWMWDRLWWSGGKTPNVDAVPGTPWSISDPTSGPGPYCISTKMVPNIGNAATDISNANNIASLSNMGKNPSGINSSTYGPDSLYLAWQNAGVSDSGWLPAVNTIQLNALIRYDSQAIDSIYGLAKKCFNTPYFVMDNATGKCYRPDGPLTLQGPNYPIGPHLKIQYGTVAANRINSWVPAVSHGRRFFYIPYLLTGDYHWIFAMQLQAMQEITGFGPGGHSIGTYGEQLNNVFPVWGIEERGFPHCAANVYEVALLSPKTTNFALMESAPWRTLSANFHTVSSSPSQQDGGTLERTVNNTGLGGPSIYRYLPTANDGYRWGRPFDDAAAPWQMGYTAVWGGHVIEIGMNTPGFDTYYAWFMPNFISNMLNVTTNVPEYLAPAYFINTTTYQINMGAPQVELQTYADCYRYTAIDITHGNTRLLAGNCSLSALSGSNIQITMPSGQFNAGTAFYFGSAVMDFYNKSVINTPAVSGGGSGYTNGDILTLTLSTITGEVVTRKCTVQVTVSGGVVTGCTVVDPGLYVLKHPDSTLLWAPATARTATATGGTGSGATFSGIVCDYGMGRVTAVTGNVLTVDTTAQLIDIVGVKFNCRPFATNTIIGGQYKVAWSAPGDPLGTDRAVYFANPTNAYVGVLKGSLAYCVDNGFPNAAAALAKINALSPTLDPVWNYVPR